MHLRPTFFAARKRRSPKTISKRSPLRAQLDRLLNAVLLRRRDEVVDLAPVAVERRWIDLVQRDDLHGKRVRALRGVSARLLRTAGPRTPDHVKPPLSLRHRAASPTGRRGATRD